MRGTKEQTNAEDSSFLLLFLFLPHSASSSKRKTVQVSLDHSGSIVGRTNRSIATLLRSVKLNFDILLVTTITLKDLLELRFGSRVDVVDDNSSDD